MMIYLLMRSFKRNNGSQGQYKNKPMSHWELHPSGVPGSGSEYFADSSD